jgi:hypothetical protein
MLAILVSRKQLFHKWREEKQAYHKEWSNNPVDNDAKGNLDPNLTSSKSMMQSFVPNFAKNRIHHNQKANS